ncbi:uncharacterized protein TRIADDRAFT_60319 [Trichoplax adhaerens]|uniref:CRAL-TRIO domain-containing protein n=1 Tax=Trichoplax adhaerens TaxID=10228 RepID=B3S7W5_TRIAD|nr:hypothetical protein TRIADDRAFT_60319 [Trichoplax adhaerens]EDV21368.1 hypothetical protein TRIADDRAFT_60319 [Trichoplax adhaerens]|eukprot:XP_002116335.1 hypothetical protein TRIADDRAFT_60319 [Trichoplax adhaerens]
MSGHVGDLSLEQQKALNQLRNNVANILPQEELSDDYFLLRWLRARDFDLQKSEQMLRRNCRFRKEWKIEKLVKEDNIPELWRKYYPGGYIGNDKEGAPVFFVNFGRFDPKGMHNCFRPEELIKYSLSHTEEGMQRCREQSKLLGRRIEGVTVIQDLNELSLSNFHRPTIPHFIKVMQLFEDNYPEFLKRALIVNANYQQVLLEYVDRDTIPKALGGNLVDENGDPHCSAIVGHGGKIPESYYHSELVKSNERPLGDYSSVVIARADCLQLKYEIETPGTLIKWEFKTDHHNIAFGVIKLIENEDGTVEYYEVIPVTRRNCQLVAEEGDYVCEDPGTYILKFDNSFSWINSKNLQYIVEVLSPDENMMNRIGTNVRFP